MEQRLRSETRQAEVFRKGLVMAIDRTVSPWLATINGRRMPFIDEDIRVGDVVFYVDQPDPFAWARVIPDMPGVWIPPLVDFGVITLFSGVTDPGTEVTDPDPVVQTISETRRVFGGGTRWTGGVVFAFASKPPESIDEGYLDTFEIPVDTTSLIDGVQPTGGPVQWYKNLGDNELSAWYLGVLGADDMTGIRATWDGHRAYQAGVTYWTTIRDGTFQWDLFEGTTGVLSASVATEVVDAAVGERVFWPEVSPPGEDWLILLLAQTVPDATVSASDVEAGDDETTGQPEYDGSSVRTHSAKDPILWWEHVSEGTQVHKPWIEFSGHGRRVALSVAILQNT